MENKLKLSERIAALQVNGENGWKQRVVKDDLSQQQQLSTSLASLTESQEGWRKRVAKKDSQLESLSSNRAVVTRNKKKPPPANINFFDKINSNEISVPIINDELFNSFFLPSSIREESAESKIELVTLEREQMLKARIKKPRKPLSKRSNGNPLKSQKISVAQSYINRRVEIGGYLAEEGLKGVEDFGSVQLKSANDKVQEFAQLLKVKGRSVSVVKVHQNQIFMGASYVLVVRGKKFATNIGKDVKNCHNIQLVKKRAYVFQPPLCPLIERTRTEEISSRLPDFKIIKVGFEGSNWSEFLNEFGVNKLTPKEDEDEDDEDFFLKGYLYQDGNFIPYDQIWECQLTFSVLKNADKLGQILLFDFRTELYLYCGVNSENDEAFNLAEKIIKTEAHIIYEKVTRYLEPLSFIFKFSDWPPCLLMNKKKFVQKLEKLLPLDLTHSFSCHGGEEDEQNYFDFWLEGVNLSRGIGEEYFNYEDFRRYKIETKSLEKWLMDGSKGDLNRFRSWECYVIKWVYNVTYLTRDLKGRVSSVPTRKGRDRVCWFFWFGNQVSPIERGKISTQFIMGESNIEYFQDDEGSGREQHAIEESFEPNLFNSLFEGNQIREITKNLEKLFIVKGSRKCEIYLQEIAQNSSHLLSHGVYLLQKNAKTSYKYIGNKSSELHRKFVENYQENEEIFSEYKKIESSVIKSGLKFGLKNAKIIAEKIIIEKETPFPLSRLEIMKLLETDVVPKILLIEADCCYFLVFGRNNGDCKFNSFRRAVLESVVKFVKDKNCFIVESELFGNNFLKLFPDLTNFSYFDECNINDEWESVVSMEQNGWLMGKICNAEMSKSEKRAFSLYFDWNRVGDYLSDEEFFTHVGVSREEFGTLAAWKQRNLLTPIHDKISTAFGHLK